MDSGHFVQHEIISLPLVIPKRHVIVGVSVVDPRVEILYIQELSG